MNEALAEVRPDAIENNYAVGALHVHWRATRRAEAGWHVHCLLRLGAEPEPPAAASALVILTPEAPLGEFHLDDGTERAHGALTLSGHAHHRHDSTLALDLYHGHMEEIKARLCNWRVCRPCDNVAPTEGSATLDPAGQLRADWTITGAADANQKVILALSSADGRQHARRALTPRQPEWRQLIRHDSAATEVMLRTHFHADGTIALDSVIFRSDTPVHHVVLATLPGDVAPPDPRPGPAPWPEPDPDHAEQVALEAPRIFAPFTYPRALRAPSAAQQARRFFSIANAGPLQQALATDKAKPDRAAMQAAAQAFISPPSGTTSDYVARIGSLPGPMGRLHGEPVCALLSLRPATAEALVTAMEALLGVPVTTFLASPDYASQLASLQDSLTALLVTATPLPHHASALTRALMVCHAAEWLAAVQKLAQAGRSSPAEGHHAPRRLREVLQASVLLPSTIFPLPQPPAASTVAALGYADLQVIRQRLKGYRLGELAHVENVMRGETREELRQQRDISDDLQRDRLLDIDDARQQLGYHGGALQAETNASNPISELKREFDSLQQQYASDGLSVTVSGGWTDTVDGPAALQRQAAHYARQLLDHACHRVARKIGQERRQRMRQEFSLQQRRRFHNEAGDAHLTGLYHWVDQVHRAHVEHLGTRLILEYTLAAPAANFIARSNALHGWNLTVPPPPWQASEGVAAVTSAYDLTRDNYLPLARRYGADVAPPPPSRRLVSASLGAAPPQPLTTLTVPEGYQASAASVSYAWSVTPTAASVPPSFDVLVGAAALKIDPSSAVNPGVLPVPNWQPCSGAVPAGAVAIGLSYALIVTLECDCVDEAPPFRAWQHDTYAAIMRAYHDCQQQTERVMGELAANASGSDAGRLETEYAALRQGATDALSAPGIAIATATDRLTPDQAAFDLLPFFRQAVAWAEMSVRYAGASDASGLAKARDGGLATAGDDSFRQFLQAASARLLLPVRPAFIVPMLYYLSSNGSFWLGESQLCPVLESDLVLANEWKTLGPRAATVSAGSDWEVAIATAMLMLRQDDRLPAAVPATEEPDHDAGA